MKILQVISSLEFGGAEKLVTELTCILKVKGITIDMAVFSASSSSLLDRLRAAGVRVFLFGHSPYHPFNCIQLIRLAKNYDIVHTHNYAPQLFGALATYFTKAKWITTEHSPSNRRRNKRLFSWIDKWMYQRYDSIIGISTTTIQNLISFVGNLNKQPILIPNGIDVAAFYSATPLSSLRNTARFVIVNVAGFRYEKDQDTLIQAMTYLPENEYELWLVGDGERRKELEKLTEQLKLTHSVRFLGKRADVPQVLKAADVVAMCSHYEGLSLSNIEGMSVGKPFIADDVVGLREITQGAGLLFPYQDAKACAQLIMRLKNNAQLYQDVAARCYQRAQQYDIHTTCDAYLKIYHEL